MQSAILVRHGETTFSARGLVSGRADVRCPLSARGVEQARRLADELAGQDVDLCVTSELERTRQTADIALAGRDVPRITLRELNDPLYGDYESGPLDAYLVWATTNDSGAKAPGGGEARQAIVARYAAGLRFVLERPERAILVVTHSLPIAYVLLTLAGTDPAPRVPLVEYAKPHLVTTAELRGVVERLEAWCAAPTW
jgi:broad specificity phosphatase PhoE